MTKPLDENGDRIILASRYWNRGEYAICVVAAESQVKDVGAYIGANLDHTAPREVTEQLVLKEGIKLSKTEAFAMLPKLEVTMNEQGLHYRH